MTYGSWFRQPLLAKQSGYLLLLLTLALFALLFTRPSLPTLAATNLATTNLATTTTADILP
jgi:hypothetical protein